MVGGARRYNGLLDMLMTASNLEARTLFGGVSHMVSLGSFWTLFEKTMYSKQLKLHI